MNTTLSKIDDDLKEALKNKQQLRISTLRLLKNALLNLEIEKQRILTQEEIWPVILKEINQRKEAIGQYQKGGREDLAEKEKQEIEILSVYLPTQLSEEEIKRLIKEMIFKTKAGSLADLGKVMKEVMSKAKGKVDGARVAEIVKEELGRK